MSRYFTFQNEKSNKFWMIDVNGTSYTVKYGRIGADGKETVKEFASDDICNKESEKLIAEKIKKGYVEDTTYSK